MKSGDGVTVYRRDRAGSGVKEVLAIGTIDAPCDAVEAALDDPGVFDSIIPYMSGSTVIAKDGSSVVSHHRITLPSVAPRDVVVRLEEHARDRPDGQREIHMSFTSEERGPPPADGVVRVEALEGMARIQGQGSSTRVEIVLFVEPGGRLPASLVNLATVHAAPMVIDNLEKVALASR